MQNRQMPTRRFKMRRPPSLKDLMARKDPLEDPIVASARAAFLKVQDELSDSRHRLVDGKRQMEKIRLLADKSRHQEEDARALESDAQQYTDTARRKAVDARRTGQSQFRYTNDQRRWEEQARRSGQKTRHWEDDARRHETEHRELSEEMRDLSDEIEALEENARISEQHLERIKRTRDERKSEVSAEARSASAQESLSITSTAVATLKEMLDSTPNREPGQALRLTIAPTGGVRLTLDSRRLGDTEVSHLGMIVLLIKMPMPEQLLGAILDVHQTHDGSMFTLSRAASRVESDAELD